MNLEALQIVIVMVTVSVATITDIKSRRIPNWITFPAILFGFIVSTLRLGVPGLGLSLLGVLAGSLILVAPVAMRWWGAGDLKLLAALGAIGGPSFVLWAGLYSLVAGGALAILVLLARRQTAPVLAGIAVDLYTQQTPRAESGIRLPYAVPIAVGTLIALVVR